MRQRYPEKDTANILAGFSELVFDDRFDARFSPEPHRDYATATGLIQASPVQLKVP